MSFQLYIAKCTTKDPNCIFVWLLPRFSLVNPLYIKQCHLRIFVSTNLQFPLSVVGCLMGAVTLWTNDRGGWVVGEWVTRRRTHILNGPPTISHNRPQSVSVHKLCKTGSKYKDVCFPPGINSIVASFFENNWLADK